MTSLSVLVAVFLCSGSVGLDTPGYRPDSPDSLSGVFGLLPGVSGSCYQTHIFLCGYYVICITHVLHIPAHPTVKDIRASVVLLCTMAIFDVCKVKFEI